jgi:N-acetylneuraminic acid mutarotase
MNGGWALTGSMGTGRTSPTATLLPNGKVLVAGGAADFGTAVASAELYDPALGTWSSTGAMNVSRNGHTATLLSNGKVLVAGGVGTSNEHDAELYDPTSGTWAVTGSLAEGRHNHSATLLPSGKVLVAGGNVTGNARSSAEVYDPASGLWSTTGSMSVARDSFTATLLTTGKVLVAGGFPSFVTAGIRYVVDDRQHDDRTSRVPSGAAARRYGPRRGWSSRVLRRHPDGGALQPSNRNVVRDRQPAC